MVLALAAATAPSALAAPGGEVKIEFSCTSVTFNYEGFPNANNNTVKEAVFVDGKNVAFATFHFNGPTGSNTLKVHVPPGHHSFDARAQWETNGVKGGKDIQKVGGITCPADPSYVIEKDQRLAGTKTYTQEELHLLKAGKTIEYAIEVENTGNVPLTLSELTDPNCEAITGGPSEIGIGQEAIFFCKHTLTAADASAEQYCNVATITGTPPEGQGAPKTQESNKVCAEMVHKAGFNQEFSCKQVTFKFFKFPNLPGNTVKEAIYADGVQIYKGTFTFNGPSGENTVVINLPPGKHKNVDVRATWFTNGIKGGEDHAIGSVNCVPEPDFTIVDKQKIAGGSGEFTEGPVSGKVGEIDDYHVTIKNTGNVPFQITSFFDVFTEITTEGVTCPVAPKSNLAPGESTEAQCEKELLVPGEGKDQANAEVKPSEGPNVSHTSNTDVVNISA